MKRIDTSRKADIRYVIGGTGAGKSAYIKQEIQNDDRILIYDPDTEYEFDPLNRTPFDLTGVAQFTDVENLLDYLEQHKNGPFRASLITESPANFEACCMMAFTLTNLTFVAEELADVTSPGKAPPEWGRLIRRGARKRNIKIMATTQRPAEADKTIFSQATIVRSGRMGTPDDRKTVAKVLGVQPDDLNLLPLDYLELNKHENSLYGGNARDKTRVKIR